MLQEGRHCVKISIGELEILVEMRLGEGIELLLLLMLLMEEEVLFELMLLQQ